MSDPPNSEVCDGCDEYVGRGTTFVRVGQSYNWVCQSCQDRIEGVLDGADPGVRLVKTMLDQAEANVDRWGNQSPLTLFLAAVEELGEVAIELDAQDDGDHPAGSPEARSRALVADMATMGRETRQFLESTFEEPAGKPKPGAERDDIRDDIDVDVTDPDAIQDEVDDLAPLLVQLTWALAALDGDTDD